ncbi:LysM peptidoglycan-binding domain-containing protein [Amycolatopsis aidingensis]|uniref:LysM peptidoglycan-binding domain-containing protein n=1 Tax=Amycolatopsis aidingensis TaxID=2842453 RepID=UPI001C0C55AA|nr:LysM peptidoglycan-binding domain-containing protein [Amycolatopsis aidingensis]
MRTLNHLGRVLAALLALATLALAPPVLLWLFRSAFLPDHLPTWPEITGWLTERDTGEVFLGMLVLAGLIAWLQLVIALGVETAALVRGTPAPRLRGIRWAQITAGVLLAVITSTATAGATETPPAAPSSTLVSTTTPPAPGDSTAAPPADPAPADDHPTDPAPSEIHTVRPGESLMSIARDRLGNENRYDEIFDLNCGRPQKTGGTLRDVALIKPGWELLLPPADTPAARTEPAYRVKPGDTLCQIARDTLGDEHRYLEIFELNKGIAQPGGTHLNDPDLIYPDTLLRIPNTPAEQPPEPPPPRRSTEPPDAPPPSTAPELVAPPPAQPPAPQATEPANDAEYETPIPLLAAGVGGLLAAGILAVLGARRMLAHRRRLPGHRLSHLEVPGDLETALRMTEQPATAHTLDASLRTLADHLRRADRELPAVRSAVVGARGITLHPHLPDGVAAQDAPAPFRGGDGTDWTLDPNVELLDPQTLDTTPAPYPTLVSLGHDTNRDLVLVNLEQIGAIVLTGSTDQIEAVLLAMAWDLAAATWADHLVVTLVGIGQTTAAHNPGRLRYTATVDDVLDTFQRRAHEVATSLHEAGTTSIGAARGHDTAEDTWTPEIILSAHPFTAEQQDRLRDLVATDGPATSLAAVITGGEAEDALPGAWHIDVSTPTTWIEQLDREVELQRLTPAQASELVAALAAADNAVQVPAEDYHGVPPEPTHIPEPLDPDDPRAGGPAFRAELDAVLDQPTTSGETDQQHPDVPEIRVLGPVGLHNVDVTQVEAKKLNRLTELAAYLALHPGVTSDELSRQLGTSTQPWSAATRQGYVSRLRTWLGRDHDGQLYLPNVDAHHGGYRLSPAMRCDWHHFQHLAHRGLRHDPADGLADLQQALNLVRGMPFSNIPHRRYAWSSWLQREMIDAIVDVAHTVADTCQKADNLPAARRALARGLQAEPVSELLHRDLLRVEYRAGNLAGVKETADRLDELATALDIELDEETSELVHKLLQPRYRASIDQRV